MTVSEARQKVLNAANAALQVFGDEAVVLDSETLIRPYGWVFFYDSKKFMDTGNLSYALAGNGPVVVLSRDGSVHRLGTAQDPDQEIAAFETRMKLR